MTTKKMKVRHGSPLSRRELLLASAGAMLIAGEGEGVAMPHANEPKTALCFNEDDSHFYSTRAGKKLDAEIVSSFVDQYGSTQIRELMLCVNCMRASFDSKVWDPIWRGYDPNGPDDQPLLASTSPDNLAGARGWIHTAWQLAQDGIDPYALWMARSRKKGISPWLSMRMNDIHNVDDERSLIHSEFWRQHPEYRRVSYRFASWTDRAFDYGRPEVREYSMKLISELADRYDFDGLELDWMRFGYHFRPGHESEGIPLLTQFVSDVRKLLNGAEKRRGHKIKLGARVPSRPYTSLGLGMDAVAWARNGLVDLLVATPFWASIETDMPIELWKSLLAGTKAKLAAGLELLLKPYPGYAPPLTNNLEMVRGAATSLLDRGADRIYLFNYMDSQTAMEHLSEYPVLLRECGSLGTMSGKTRRHIVTYADTWAPGEPSANPLPVDVGPGAWQAFRIHTGPKPASERVEVRLGVEGATETDVKTWELRVNGDLCACAGSVLSVVPDPHVPLYGFSVPSSAMNRGYNLIEFVPRQNGRIVWAEFAFIA